MIEQKKHVLIVDDSFEIQALLRVFLESEGYLVNCASNGEEALDFLNGSPFLPGIIFLDLRMPLMCGLSFLEYRKNQAELMQIPVVLMSGDEDLGKKEILLRDRKSVV